MYRKTYACLNEYFTVQYLESDFVLSKERHLKHNSFYVFVSAKNKQDGHLLYFDVARQSIDMNAGRMDSQQSFHAATFQQKIYFTCMSCYHSNNINKSWKKLSIFSSFQ